jgi:hypothetical protein
MTSISIAIGQHTLRAEIAADPVARALGLMFRRSLAPDAGMLFVFPELEILSFWMSHTFVPLSVAFLDGAGRILNIEDMSPLDDRSFHLSIAPACFGLEVNCGWFAARGIGPGDHCQFRLPGDLHVT